MPTPAEVLARTAVGYATRPERFMRAQMRAWRDGTAIINKRAPELFGSYLKTMSSSSPLTLMGQKPERPTAPTGAAPRTPFNKSITAHRRYAFRSTALDNVKAIKNATGATVNDVVMAICAGGLRRYLIKHDMLTDQPLVAMVPVSIRTGEEEERWTNRVSSIFTSLPTHLDDPAARLTYMHDAMVEAKTSFDLIPADALQDFTQFSPPAVFTQASAVMTRYKMADRTNPPVNLVVSNIPGPRQALYLGAAKLDHYYPVSTVAEGQGLNITVQSYEDKLDFGLVGCRELVPDIWDILDMIVDELDELGRLVEAS